MAASGGSEESGEYEDPDRTDKIRTAWASIYLS